MKFNYKFIIIPLTILFVNLVIFLMLFQHPNRPPPLFCTIGNDAILDENSFKIMSFNVRFNPSDNLEPRPNPEFQENINIDKVPKKLNTDENIVKNIRNNKRMHWDNRKNKIISILDSYMPDIMGLQDTLKQQYNFLKNTLKNYDSVYYEGPQTVGVPIFYLKSKWELIDNGTFWLSSTPSIIGSKIDGSTERISSWVKLRNQITGFLLLVINTHFDNTKEYNRFKSAVVISNEIDSFLDKNENYHIVITGDFNAESDELAGLMIRRKFFEVTTDIAEKQGTFHDWNGGKDGGRPDHIFVSDNIGCYSFDILMDYKMEDGIKAYPSDHFPIMATLHITDTK